MEGEKEPRVILSCGRLNLYRLCTEPNPRAAHTAAFSLAQIKLSIYGSQLHTQISCLTGEVHSASEKPRIAPQTS